MEKRITQIYFQIVFCGTGRTKYQIDSVPKYILDQPELHKKKSFKIGIPKNLFNTTLSILSETVFLT